MKRGLRRTRARLWGQLYLAFFGENEEDDEVEDGDATDEPESDLRAASNRADHRVDCGSQEE
ncbi:hypothetical protein [Haladaptatus halobius]|uniref:hypothetical protein n=1 Tax=Haladaptatus halobius TaxID=2884875 RepID=UPI001D09A2DB|nr:hypothetical protein [Haladaptatus halobius]